MLVGKPTPQTGTRHRFAFYCDEWLRLRKSKIRESTYIKYDTVLEKHIKPKLGGCFPMGITTGVVDDFIRELLFEDELAVKPAHDILVVLHGVLKHTAAQTAGDFPAVEINYHKESRREMRILSRDEQTQLVRYLLTDTDACKFGVLLMLLSGVRIGELCALKWGNIDLKEQTISIIATLKDLSRLGRDYVSVGNYTDVYFPDHDIRFIAVNDGIDSEEGESEIAPFKNILNEMYAQDISKKIRSSHRLRGSMGEPLSQPPYGYMKSAENKKKWVIDQEAADVVKSIFKMCLEGKGNETIARTCKREKFLFLWHIGKARDYREAVRKHNLTRISGARQQYKRFCLSRNIAVM